MSRRIYKAGCLVEARNTKYEKGFGIILSGPHQSPYDWEKTEQFDVYWFKPTSIQWNQRQAATRMTKNQIRALRSKKS